MLSVYLGTSVHEKMLDDVKCMLTSGIQQNHTPEEVMCRIEGLLQDTEIYPNFTKFIQDMKQKDDTWKFWLLQDFVFCNCYNYIGLYLAIRGSNLKLRVSSLKQMAPIFAAFDRDVYKKIIPNHRADIQKYPKEILRCFKAGGFTVNINGLRWHSVALDEAHEMCINKDLKGAIVRPTTAYLQKTSLFYNYRIKAYKHFIQQIFPEKSKKCVQLNTIMDSSPQSIQQEQNILQMCSEIKKHKLLLRDLDSNRGLFNAFNDKKQHLSNPQICSHSSNWITGI